MKYKVQITLSGTIETVGENEQPTLFEQQDEVTDGQAWRLNKEGLPEFVIKELTKQSAGKIIGMFEKLKTPPPEKTIMQQIVEKRHEKEEAGEPVNPLPWEPSTEIIIEVNDPSSSYCTIAGCDQKQVAKKLCRMHYNEDYKRRKSNTANI